MKMDWLIWVTLPVWSVCFVIGFGLGMWLSERRERRDR